MRRKVGLGRQECEDLHKIDLDLRKKIQSNMVMMRRKKKARMIRRGN